MFFQVYTHVHTCRYHSASEEDLEANNPSIIHSTRLYSSERLDLADAELQIIKNGDMSEKRRTGDGSRVCKASSIICWQNTAVNSVRTPPICRKNTFSVPVEPVIGGRS